MEDVKYNGNYKMNSVMEIKELKVQASRGESSAQLVLAAAYYNGDGVEQSYDAAFLLYKIAAERGNITSAWFMLGSMAQEGQGQAKNIQNAVEYYMKAVNGGSGQAAMNIGVLFEVGVEIQRDLDQALIYYKKAMELGNARGAYNYAALVYAHAKDNGDVAEAFYGYCLAHKLGFPKALEGIYNCVDRLKINDVIKEIGANL